ncbi:hypothetical protein [Sulfurimonas sp.]|uniref:HvfA family oxazolone/thioamide-modified RiPP metallophore n=1 Tax=Sulfurimonas sp. TaxID=2022749 RepID=UPI00356516BF
MKKLNVMALLFGAALFLGLGATTVSADMKCGAGKCGSSMQKPVKKCGGEKERTMRSNSDKCGAGKKGMMMDDDSDNRRMKRDSDKCGSGKRGMMMDDDSDNRRMMREDERKSGKCGSR